MNCWSCGKSDNFQDTCKTRIAAGAPMANKPPYKLQGCSRPLSQKWGNGRRQSVSQSDRRPDSRASSTNSSWKYNYLNHESRCRAGPEGPLSGGSSSRTCISHNLAAMHSGQVTNTTETPPTNPSGLAQQNQGATQQTQGQESIEIARLQADLNRSLRENTSLCCQEAIASRTCSEQTS